MFRSMLFVCVGVFSLVGAAHSQETDGFALTPIYSGWTGAYIDYTPRLTIVNQKVYLVPDGSRAYQGRELVPAPEPVAAAVRRLLVVTQPSLKADKLDLESLAQARLTQKLVDREKLPVAEEGASLPTLTWEGKKIVSFKIEAEVVLGPLPTDDSSKAEQQAQVSPPLVKNS